MDFTEDGKKNLKEKMAQHQVHQTREGSIFALCDVAVQILVLCSLLHSKRSFLPQNNLYHKSLYHEGTKMH